MSNIIQIGPLVLPLDRLTAIAALWLFIALGGWALRRWQGAPANLPFWAVVVGIAGARIGHVVENHASFAEQPLTALYLWQGGFAPLWGVMAAALLVALRARAKARAALLACLALCAGGWLAVAALSKQAGVRPLPRNLVAATLDGQPVSIDALAGRPFVLNLWASWCGPCRREMPMLIDMAGQSPDVPILLVNQGEDAATVRAFMAKEGLAIDAVRLDAAGAIGHAVASPALPTTIFVDAQGQIVRTHVGEISRATLAQGIAAISR
ncbi:TlpA disulfide reductase family protein [Sphingomonas sp. C3-2]|uniref:TlpA disulfide reductase family protein n=1 Tax=Sphingomonas sp. C3-2 TaxID=3062169 RepID=UPI00294B2004|nr:TlpA disulfide reductase family protein [Sphingomonas sp. C3-2]WOK35842.1 TlpA disulfide reductase family protein [Sphingomonas sp. C3-2]